MDRMEKGISIISVDMVTIIPFYDQLSKSFSSHAEPS